MSRPSEARLSHISLLILLALTLKPRHGYELIQQIHEDTNGTVVLKAGSLYGAMKPLYETNLIEEIPFTGHPRRRQYRLTRKGWNALANELSYYHQLMVVATDRGLV